MTVPGVSGGSMAMILGIYDTLIYSVSNLFQYPKKCLAYLFRIGIGALGGILLIARLMDRILIHYPMPARFFFLGAVLGGIPIIFKSAEVKKVDIGILIFPLLGAACVLGLSKLPAGLFQISEELSFAYVFLQLLGGWIIAIALVLPGISTSHMLLMLGLYETVIRAVRNMEVLILIPLMVGVLVGTFVTSKVLDRLFERYKKQTYLTTFGFLLGSLVELFPGIPASNEMGVCLLCLAVGCAVLYGISRLDKQA